MKFKVTILYFSLIFAKPLHGRGISVRGYKKAAQQVSTPDGPIKGSIKATNSGRTYYAYYSIPYAKPPTGSRRFLATEPIDPWTQVYDGTTEKPNLCYQLYAEYDAENEDCLYLNVFTPQDPTAQSNNFPVMVNIHGGGFISGSGLESTSSTGGFSPKYLLENDVIFVSFNYRLGVFGFLSTGDSVIPGNAGLKDQVLALKWVQKNIASFGGDPTRVTIFGQSAGGASVGYQISSPAASGLFAGGILESGTSLCPWAYQRNQTEISFKTGAVVDSQFASSRNSKDLLTVLQKASAKDIDTAALTFANTDSGQPGAAGRTQLQQGFYFAPVIEAPNDNAFITEYQYETLAKGTFNKVPILIGVCSEEGLMNVDQWLHYLLEGYDSDPSYMNPQNLHISDYSTWQQVGNILKNNYSPTSSFANNPLGAIRYFTEQDFFKSETKHAELQSSHTDVYFYQFSYTGTMGGNTDHKYPGSLNVTHTEEWGYIFGGYPIEYYPVNDQLVHNRIMRIWTNFATHKNPTPNPEELLQNITWPKVQSGNFQYVNIGNFTVTDLRIAQGKPRADQMNFWDNIYNTYGNRPFDSY